MCNSGLVMFMCEKSLKELFFGVWINVMCKIFPLYSLCVKLSEKKNIFDIFLTRKSIFFLNSGFFRCESGKKSFMRIFLSICKNEIRKFIFFLCVFSQRQHLKKMFFLSSHMPKQGL